VTKKIASRGMQWPDFNQIPAEKRGNMDWSYFIDQHGIGWHYDKVENIGTGEDFEYACTCIPKDFANEAVLLFPDLVTIINEADFEDFFDNRSRVRLPGFLYDVEVLHGISVKKQLGIPLEPSDQDALDPEKPQVGITKNYEKTWELKKAKQKITIDPKQRKN